MKRLALPLILLLVAAAAVAQNLAAASGAELERAAIAVAQSRNPAATAELAKLLGDPAFLARLDDLADPPNKTRRLRSVFSAIQSAPSPATEALCLALAADPDFTADPIRLNYLLPALAAVRAMSDHAVALFRRTNAEGYFAVNAPLLVANGSAPALNLFSSMIADRSVDPESRVDALHRSVVPYRAELPVLRMAQQLLAQKLEPPVRVGLLESLFDYQPRRWYGPIPSPPVPQPWESLAPARRRIIRDLASQNARDPSLPPELRQRLRQVGGR